MLKLIVTMTNSYVHYAVRRPDKCKEKFVVNDPEEERKPLMYPLILVDARECLPLLIEERGCNGQISDLQASNLV